MTDFPIDMSGVWKSFGAQVAVRDLNLKIPRGQLFCLLGPNGAGKTTSMKMLCGLLRPDQGSIRVNGHDLRTGGEAVRRILGYIPDTPFLYERLTPGEFMEFIGDVYGVPRPRVRSEQERWFDLLGLDEHRDHLIKDLSHGLRQRLVYAATFLRDPEIMLVDEPFIGLDPHSIRMIKNLLRERTRNGVTIILTTHILALAEDLADRIGIILRGQMIALGTLAEITAETSLEGRLEDVFLRLTEEA